MYPEQQKEHPQHQESLFPPITVASFLSRENCLSNFYYQSVLLVFKLYIKSFSVLSFVCDFFDSTLYLGFTHDIVYSSTLFIFITVEYCFH